MSHIVGDERRNARSADLTNEENDPACALALDLLAEWFAEQGYVAE